MSTGLKSFSREQKKILALCFAIYFSAYVGRLNMSATLADIMAEFRDVSNAGGGLLQTFFAAAYAAGQLGFGLISDRIKPKRLLMLGLIGSAACNIAFSFMRAYGLLVAVWTINGVFQAMLWTPIVITMAHTFEPEKRKNASFVMSFTLVAGHFAAWGLAMGLARLISWRYSYRLPALVLLAAACAAYRLLPDGIRSASKRADSSNNNNAPFRELIGTGLIFMLVCCMANGFVRDGVITWAPTILNAESRVLSLIIPLINLIGVLLGAYLVRRPGVKIRTLIGCMMLFVSVISALLSSISAAPMLALSLLLGLISATLYGTNPLLTTLVPMQYDSYGRVGLVAGMVDAFIYLGSSLAGTLTGLVSQTGSSWRGVYALWCAFTLVGAICALISSKNKILY